MFFEGRQETFSPRSVILARVSDSIGKRDPPGMFAEEEQSLLGGCRTTNQPMLEILVLLAAKIAR